jgi:hypothetical protein
MLDTAAREALGTHTVVHAEATTDTRATLAAQARVLAQLDPSTIEALVPAPRVRTETSRVTAGFGQAQHVTDASKPQQPNGTPHLTLLLRKHKKKTRT